MSTEITLVTCCDCGGKGYRAKPRANSGSIDDWHTRAPGKDRQICRRCNGSGTMDARMVEWIAIARVLNSACDRSRLGPIDLVIKLEAGITEIARARSGLIDPKPLLTRATELGWVQP